MELFDDPNLIFKGSLVLGFILVLLFSIFLLQKDLAKRSTIALLRCLIQLFILSQVLVYVFYHAHESIKILTCLFIIVMAILNTSLKSDYKFNKNDYVIYTLIYFMISPFLASFATSLMKQQFEYKFFIPILGMILGNSLNGIVLSRNAFFESLRSQRELISIKRVLGATVFEAIRLDFIKAIKIGLTPMLNVLSIVGLVSLPGMLTGQLIANEDVMTAVLNQFIIMVVIFSAIFLITYLGLYLSIKLNRGKGYLSDFY